MKFINIFSSAISVIVFSATAAFSGTVLAIAGADGCGGGDHLPFIQ